MNKEIDLGLFISSGESGVGEGITKEWSEEYDGL